MRGKDADFVAIDTSSWEPLASTLIHAARAVDEAAAAVQTLFALLIGLREPAIASVFVQGREIGAGQVR
jgi:guanine deaminase